MKIEEILAVKLLEFERRLRFVQTGKSVATFLCIGLSAYLCLCILDKFVSLPLNWPALFLAVCGLSTASGFFVGRFRRISPLSVACRVDEALSLQERVSTAWEYRSEGRSNELVPLLIKDAVRCLQEVKPRKVFPHQWLKRGRYVAYLLIGIFLVSSFSHLFPFPFEDAAPPSSLREEGRSLMRSAERLMEKRPEALRRASSLTRQMRQLGEEMYQRKLEEEQALQAYSSLESKITQELKMTQAELLEKLKSLEEGKWESVDEEKLSQIKEALQKKEYGKAKDLLEQMSKEGKGKEGEELLSYAEELESLSKMRKLVREGRQRLKEGSGKEKEEKLARMTKSEEESALKGDKKNEGHSLAQEEGFVLGQGLAEGPSPFPGRSPSFRVGEEEEFEVDEEGRLVKVKGQLEQGSFLMSLLRDISRSPEKGGSSTKQALISYGEMMINKLAGEKIPLSYKEQVKRYFSSLEPK